MHDPLGGRFVDLITKPTRLMDNVAVSPQWLTPVLVIAVVMVAFTWLVAPISGPEQLELMRDSKLMNLVPEEQWQQQYDEALNPTTTGRLFSALGAGASTFGMILLFGLILGFFAKMSGGTGTFKQALGVTAWASVIPFGLGILIKVPLVMMTESMFSVNIGLAAFLGDVEPKNVLFQILHAYGDFLSWWGLGLIVIGFQKTHGLSRTTALVTVLLPWILATAIPLGVSLLFMM